MSALSVYVSQELDTVTKTNNQVQTATHFSTTTIIPQVKGYLPLTTQFTQPAHCQSTLLAKQNYYELGYQNDCYPSGHEKVVAFSPGLCPSGFEMANMQAHLSYPVQTTADAKPTRISVAYCCPSGFKYENQNTGIPSAFIEPCASTVSAGLPFPLMNVTYATVSPAALAAGSLALLSPMYTSMPKPTNLKAAVIRASGIQVAWQSTDSEIVKLVGTSAAALDATASAAAGSGGSGGLSQKAIILIAVLVPVLSLAFILAAILLFLRFKKRKNVAAESAAEKQLDTTPSQEALDSHSEGEKSSVEAFPPVDIEEPIELDNIGYDEFRPATAPETTEVKPEQKPGSSAGMAV